MRATTSSAVVSAVTGGGGSGAALTRSRAGGLRWRAWTIRRRRAGSGSPVEAALGEGELGVEADRVGQRRTVRQRDVERRAGLAERVVVGKDEPAQAHGLGGEV